MTENIKCPNCGSTIENERGFSYMTCYQCGCKWDESKRQPQAAPTGDKSECLNLYEEAVDLIDSLNSEQRLDYSDYSLLRDAVDAIGNCIEENLQPPNTWIACSERLPEAYETVLTFVPPYELETHFMIEGRWNGRDRDEITHWQPLPQPPETGKDGE